MRNLNDNNRFLDPLRKKYSLVHDCEWLISRKLDQWTISFCFSRNTSQYTSQKWLPRTLCRCWNIGKLIGEHETTIGIGSICGKFNVNLVTFKYSWNWWSCTTCNSFLSTFTANAQFVIHTILRFYILPVPVPIKQTQKQNITNVV